MLRNNERTWGWPSKLLHWIAAVAVLILLIHGWWMTHMSPRPERFANYSWHAALGYDLMALLVLRLLWRWTNAVPDQPPDSKTWERWAAQAGHFGLYVLMFTSALTGWALAGTLRRPLDTDLFGLKIPLIYASRDRTMHNLLEEAHMVLSYLLAALIVVHLAAAIWHHVVKRNDVLTRMIWGPTRS